MRKMFKKVGKSVLSVSKKAFQFSFILSTVESELLEYGQYYLSLEKALTLSLNSTRLIRTPVNADNGHFFWPHQHFIVNCVL